MSEDGDITLKFGLTTLLDSYLKFINPNVEIVELLTIDTRLGFKFGGFANDKNLKVFMTV